MHEHEYNPLISWDLTMVLYDPSSHSASVLWLVWLSVQFVVSSILMTVAAFRLWWTYPNECAGRSITDTNTTSACALNVGNMSTAAIACVVTVIDLTINAHFLVHKVFGGKADPSRYKCKLFCCSQCLVPASLTRVSYCWILIHCLLVTKAASIDTWSWQAPDPDVHADTTTFALTCLGYLLLVGGILLWLCSYGCCCCYSKRPIRAHEPNSTGCNEEAFSIPTYTTYLVISDTVYVVAMFALRFSGNLEDTTSFVIVGLLLPALSCLLWIVAVCLVGCSIKFKKSTVSVHSHGTDHNEEVFGPIADSPECHHFKPLLCGLPFSILVVVAVIIMLSVHMTKTVMVLFIPLAAWIPITIVHSYRLALDCWRRARGYEPL